MKRLLWISLLVIACGGDSTRPDSYESIGGRWVGTVAEPQDTTDIAFQIVDRGGPLTGDMRFGLGAGEPAFPFVGTREGSGIELTATIYTESTRVIATINGDRMAGTITFGTLGSAELSLIRQ